MALIGQMNCSILQREKDFNNTFSTIYHSQLFCKIQAHVYVMLRCSYTTLLTILIIIKIII